MGGKLVYRMIETTFAVTTAFAVRRALKATWQRSRGAAPPEDPKSPDTAWKDAVGWAAASAAGVTIGQLVARRGAELVYEALTGQEPPHRRTDSKKGRELAAGDPEQAPAKPSADGGRKARSRRH